MMTTQTNLASGRDRAGWRVWPTTLTAFKIFLRIDGTQRAGAFAHFAFFSLFPSIILLVAAASIFVDRTRAAREIIGFIEHYVPMGADKEGYIFRTIEGVVAARGHASIVAIILLCWAAMRFLATMIRATNRAWGAEVHTWWRLPLKSLVLLVIVVTLVPLTVLATVWLKESQSADAPLGGVLAAMRMLAGAVIPLGVLFLGLTLFYQFAPRRTTRMREVWLPSLCATGLLAAAELLFKFYLTRFATLNAVYGALGGIMALLMWIYLSGVIFIFGACLCAARAKPLPGPEEAASP